LGPRKKKKIPKIINLRCENCGNEWEIDVEEGWSVSYTPHIGVTLYPPKDGDQSRGSKLLRCRVCNKCREIIIV